MIDASGGLREVRGIAGAFVVSDPRTNDVLSSACGADLCLSKTESHLISDRTTVDAPPGPALLAIDGSNAFLYFPSTKQFAQWVDETLVPLEATIDGEAIAVGADAAHRLQAAVRRPDGVWIVDERGNALRFVHSLARAVLLFGGDTLFTEENRVVLRRADGAEFVFDIPNPGALFPIGEHWSGVRAGAILYAIRTEPGREQLYELPEPAP